MKCQEVAPFMPHHPAAGWRCARRHWFKRGRRIHWTERDYNGISYSWVTAAEETP